MLVAKRPIIIDTDPGIDDAVSILWLIASGKFDIKAITITNGNVGLDQCVINALRTLEIADRTDIPVYAGAYRPLVRPAINASWIHGKDGLGDCDLPPPVTKPHTEYAAVAMAQIVKENVEPVTILNIGPMTNTALAILLDKEFAGKVKEIVFMGGAVHVAGNQSSRASYNVKVDPEAAKIVYNSGIPVVQIGLDVCDLVSQRMEDLDIIHRAGTAVAEFIYKITAFRAGARRSIYNETGEKVGELTPNSEVDRGSGVGLNDLTASGYLINSSWFKTMSVAMDVETCGTLTEGETIIDEKGQWGKKPNGLFAWAVDGNALVAQWVEDMIAYRSRTSLYLESKNTVFKTGSLEQ